MWFRLILFFVLAGLAIWYLDQRVFPRETVKGEKIELSGDMSEKAKQISDQVLRLIPEETRSKIKKDVEKKVDESQIVDQISQKIELALNELSGFPEKQKKELKKQIVQDVYDRLMESFENE